MPNFKILNEYDNPSTSYGRSETKFAGVYVMYLYNIYNKIAPFIK